MTKFMKLKCVQNRYLLYMKCLNYEYLQKMILENLIGVFPFNSVYLIYLLLIIYKGNQFDKCVFIKFSMIMNFWQLFFYNMLIMTFIAFHIYFFLVLDMYIFLIQKLSFSMIFSFFWELYLIKQKDFQVRKSSF